MATVKCQNPHCDYFQKPVPDGKFCPFCGEPIGITQPNIETDLQPNLKPKPQPFVSPPTVVEPSPKPKNDRAFLSLVHDSGKKFSIYEKNSSKKFYVGRKGGTKVPQPQIDLTDIPHFERVSRPHAHIIWGDRVNSYIFVDEESTNGSILNGQSLEPFQPYPLNHGDILELGREHKVMFTIELNA